MGGRLDVSFEGRLAVRPSKPAVSGLIDYLLSICRNSQLQISTCCYMQSRWTVNTVHRLLHAQRRNLGSAMSVAVSRLPASPKKCVLVSAGRVRQDSLLSVEYFLRDSRNWIRGCFRTVSPGEAVAKPRFSV